MLDIISKVKSKNVTRVNISRLVGRNSMINGIQNFCSLRAETNKKLASQNRDTFWFASGWVVPLNTQANFPLLC